MHRLTTVDIKPPVDRAIEIRNLAVGHPVISKACLIPENRRISVRK